MGILTRFWIKASVFLYSLISKKTPFNSKTFKYKDFKYSLYVGTSDEIADSTIVISHPTRFSSVPNRVFGLNFQFSTKNIFPYLEGNLKGQIDLRTYIIDFHKAAFCCIDALIELEENIDLDSLQLAAKLDVSPDPNAK